MNPKEPPVYEYVKFVGDFKFHNHGKDLFSFKTTTFRKNKTEIHIHMYMFLVTQCLRRLVMGSS